MFSRVKTFVKNHWKKAVYTGIAIQVASYGLRYAANRVLQYHEEQTKQIFLKRKKTEHFERTYTNSSTTILSLLPTLQETIETSLDSETLKAALLQKSASKLEIWEELKCIAFSRVLASIYGCSLLNLLLRVQLSVIGGYMIQDSMGEIPGSTDADNAATSSSSASRRNASRSPALNSEFQRDYLHLAHYFVKEGVQQMCAVILEKVKSVVGPISLKRRLSIQELEQIMWHVIDLIRNDDLLNSTAGPSSAMNTRPMGNCLLKYIFPDDVSRRYENFQYTQDPSQVPEESEDLKKQVVCETFDLLHSADSATLITSFETHGVSYFLDRLVDILAETQDSVSTNKPLPNGSVSNNNLNESCKNSVQESAQKSMDYNHLLSEVSTPLAKLIPVFNSFSPANLHEFDPFVRTSIDNRALKMFAANIYESFSCPIPPPF